MTQGERARVSERERANVGQGERAQGVSERERASVGQGERAQGVSERERASVGQGEKGFTVWFTGLSGSGKSTVAEMLYHEFQARGMKTEILDGDVVRQNLSKGLGFSKEDRDTNIRRIAFVADLLTRNGVATICCPISPYKEIRDEAREQIGAFVEVYVHATLEELSENRDPKGLYKKAMAGEIKGFTGVDDPYEPPENPELVLDTMVESPEESLASVLATLKQLGYVDDATPMVAGDRKHSGMTDLRVTDTGHVAKEA
jgi:adenylylsulfate kinase